MNYSDYIIYVDESGDHGLVSIDPSYPVFVLAFCIFEKATYGGSIVPAVLRFKYRYFGHDSVILHSHDIRKARSDFRILLNADVRAAFMDDLTDLVARADFTVIASCIHKARLASQYVRPDNPYDLALGFCMERAHRHLAALGQTHRTTHVVFERRGAREDRDLELTFRRIRDGANAVGPMPDLEIVFADKRHNSTGLQLADLVAHPIGRHFMAPDQPNRAYDALAPKFRKSPTGHIDGFGLKRFP